MTEVEAFWTSHTVHDEPFASAAESLAYLVWRDAEYPLFHDLMGLWGDHRKHTVLDYGCGPGNDLVGFLVHGRARRAIGVDVSQPALDNAAARLALHGVTATLIKVSDDEPGIPLSDGSVDHIYCQGVLHHVTYPAEILAEFHRVLRSGGTAAVMVYNPDSIYVRYGHGARTAAIHEYQRNADLGAPIVRMWSAAEFTELVRAAGFDVTYRGGYFASPENALWRSGARDGYLERLRDVDGYPHLGDHPAGLGGVYWLTR